MSLQADIAAEVARQAEARGARTDHKVPAAAARRKFDDSQSTPEALEQWRGLNRDDGLYKQSTGGRSRLGSLASSDAELERYARRPEAPQVGSALFRQGGVNQPTNMRIGGG